MTSALAIASKSDMSLATGPGQRRRRSHARDLWSVTNARGTTSVVPQLESIPSIPVELLAVSMAVTREY